MLDFGYYCMDCMEGMKEFPDKYFDLAVVDPPYGVDYKNGGKNKRGHARAARKDYKPFGGNDMQSPDKEYFDELVRVSKNQVIWGGNHFMSKLPFDSDCWLVWDKEQTLPTYADCELAWTSFKGQAKLFRYRWAGMLQEDMKNKEYRVHATQKPVALYKWIFNTFAEKDDIILDTHVGSASSLIAAHEMGLQYVGFEIDPYYYEVSKKRLDEETAQMNMFLDFPEILGGDE